MEITELFKDTDNLSKDIVYFLTWNIQNLLDNYNTKISNNIIQIYNLNNHIDISNLLFVFDIFLSLSSKLNENQINQTKDYFINNFNNILEDKIYYGKHNRYIFNIPMNHNNIDVKYI